MVKNHRINLNDDTKQVTETVEEDARIITEIMIAIGDKKDDDSLAKKLQNIFARVIPHSHSLPESPLSCDILCTGGENKTRYYDPLLSGTRGQYNIL